MTYTINTLKITFVYFNFFCISWSCFCLFIITVHFHNLADVLAHLNYLERHWKITAALLGTLSASLSYYEATHNRHTTSFIFLDMVFLRARSYSGSPLTTAGILLGKTLFNNIFLIWLLGEKNLSVPNRISFIALDCVSVKDL